MPDVGVEGVELVGEFTPDGFGGAEQFVEVAVPVFGHDPFGPEQEDKAFEQREIGGQPGGLEAFVGILRRAFVIQARLAHGGDDDPVAREIDGVAIGLVHGGHAPPGKGVLQGVAGAFAFEDGDELLLALLEAAQDGIGDLAVHLDVAFAGEGEGVGGGGGAGVAEQAAEDFGEEVRQQRSFLEIVGAAGGDKAGPMLEFGLPVPDDRVTWVTCVAWLHERNACDAGRGAPGAGCHKTRLGLRQKATQSHLKAIC